jgi:hypothetical protein
MSEVLAQADWQDMHHFYQSCHSAAGEKPVQRSEVTRQGRAIAVPALPVADRQAAVPVAAAVVAG